MDNVKNAIQQEEILVDTNLDPKIDELQKNIKEERKEAAPSAMKVDERGLVKAENHLDLLRYCKGLTTANWVPKRFKNEYEVYGAISYVRALGLPDVSIRQCAVIEGTPSIFGDLPLSLVQSSKELTHFKELWFDKDYNVISFSNKNLNAEVFGAVVFISRNNQEIQEFSFTLDDAKKAGSYPALKNEWLNNQKTGNKIPDENSPWMKHTKVMLRYKARSIALKSIFADKINGVSIAEYDHDILGNENMRDVSHGVDKVDVADELNNAVRN